MRRFLYTAMVFAALPLVLWHLWWRGRAQPAYRQRLRERFGDWPEAVPRGGIWLHAVSVGEVNAAAALIRCLQHSHPQYPLVITTTTPTGSERVNTLFGATVFHAYAPYDLPFALARFLDSAQPRLALFVETEIWPNTIAACRRRGIETMLINARLSERSARGYGRVGWLIRPALSQLRVLAQSDTDAQRFAALGVPANQLQVTGNIKFDLDIDSATRQRAAQHRDAWRRGGTRPIWIAASTHEGEDELLLTVQQGLPHALLILVPRHPQRCARIAVMLAERGLHYHLLSSGEDLPEEVSVLLVDTIGDLIWLYGCADLAFVGGSLVEHGGHNCLEPAAWALPILSGRHVFNFAEITDRLECAGALRVVDGIDALVAAVSGLLANRMLAQCMGAAALAVVAANRGAVSRTAALIDEVLD